MQQLIELPISEILLTPAAHFAHIVVHLSLEIGHGHFGLPAATPTFVVRGQHLAEILRFELLASLGDLTCGSQAKLLQPRARVDLAENPDPKDQRGQSSQQHEGEGIHREPV